MCSAVYLALLEELERCGTCLMLQSQGEEAGGIKHSEGLVTN